MIIYYRISSNSYTKPRMPGADKSVCLKNFLDVFKDDKIFIVKDNCDENTELEVAKILLDYPEVNVEITQLGNSGSFKYVLSKAIKNDPKEIVYFVEDDYLHEASARNALLEGLYIGDYATVYDHPDKYCSDYHYGEKTKILRSQNHHWKFSISTTMTFATRVKTLQEDVNIWTRNCDGPHPNDHQAFREVQKKLAVAIPGLAFHNDLSAYYLFPGGKSPNVENWVIKYLEKTLTQKIYKCHDGDMEDTMQDVLRAKVDGVPLIICLDQILKNKKR